MLVYLLKVILYFEHIERWMKTFWKCGVCNILGLNGSRRKFIYIFFPHLMELLHIPTKFIESVFEIADSFM